MTKYVNDAFHPSLLSSNPWSGGKLVRGHLVQDPVFAAARKEPPYALHFLFNPAEITVGIAPEFDLLPPEFQSREMRMAVARGNQQVRVGFSLDFDRTFEMLNGGTTSEGHPWRLVGVREDVKALERVVDYRPEDDMLMAQVPIYAVLGHGVPNWSLKYYGWVDRLDVAYTMFSNEMVPMRAVVDVSFSVIFRGDPINRPYQGGTVGEGTTGGGTGNPRPEGEPAKGVGGPENDPPKPGRSAERPPPKPPREPEGWEKTHRQRGTGGGGVW